MSDIIAPKKRERMIILNNILAIMEKDIFAKHLGIKIIQAGDGRSEAEMLAGEKHLNSLGIVHGGAIFSLADTAFAAASNSRGVTAVAVNVSISYCKAAQKGRIYAKAREISLNRRLATYLVEVYDDLNNLIALFQGTVYRKDKHS